MKQATIKLICALFLLMMGEAAYCENYPYRSDYLWLTVPDHANWLYKTGEKAKVEVTFTLYGMPQKRECDRPVQPKS